MKNISILGATGSIGRQTIEVVLAHPDEFVVNTVTANKSVKELAAAAVSVMAKKAVIADELLYDELADALSGTGIIAVAGVDELVNVALEDNDLIMAAMVGSAGLLPIITALRAGKTVALANKEPLIAAGSLIMRAVKENGGIILPVDSEPSAIFQCMLGQDVKNIAKIWLTASGGALKHLTASELASVTPAMALKHPTWSMGNKITIDSATLMNKGLEMIEAHWLFNVPISDIEIVIHPQSICHSLIEFCDGALLAQMGKPTMLTPIQFALSYPLRLAKNWAPLNLATLGAITFEPLDKTRFPAPDMARNAVTAGGTYPICLNAANEMAVDAFLCGRIGFTDIIELTATILDKHDSTICEPTIDEVIFIDAEVRRITLEAISKM